MKRDLCICGSEIGLKQVVEIGSAAGTEPPGHRQRKIFISYYCPHCKEIRQAFFSRLPWIQCLPLGSLQPFSALH